MTVAAVAAFAAALQGAAAASPANVRFVERVYAREAVPSHVEGVFARDLAQAYRKDTSHPGEVGEIDFDWRYGAQDLQITELKIEPIRLRPGAMPMNGIALVRATFRNLGKPGEVDYRLCRRADGQWRIAEVWSTEPGAAWSLRTMLKLDPVRVRC